MTLHHNKLHLRGFTLIELTIVIIIAGIVLAALLPLYSLYIEERQKIHLEQDLQEVRESLFKYLIEEDCPSVIIAANGSEIGSPSSPATDAQCINNGYANLVNVENGGTDQVNYPCPADPSLGPSDPNYGLEVRNAAGNEFTVTGGIVENNGVFIGALPVISMNLTTAHMIDPYGNKYAYAVDGRVARLNWFRTNEAPDGSVMIRRWGD